MTSSNSTPYWFQTAVFYELNTRAFYDGNGDGHGDLLGLIQRLDYLQELGVDCIWLLPMYPSPLRDDGYDISDYFNIAEKFGTLEEFRQLVDSAHQRGIKVIMDLVLNHCSDMHPWFQAARQDRNSPYRDYFVWSDDPATYKGVRVIFLDTHKLNWTYDESAGQYFWHRFYSTQPDLNWENPQLKQEMFNAARFWLNFGIDGFRADAVPYLIEREGTSCENLPETHVILQELRAMIDAEYPGRILLCEANMWPTDVIPYLGSADKPECQMGFHFPLMPRLFMAIRRNDARAIYDILNDTPAIPAGTQWCTFLRNHDELTLEMVTEADRQWMWQTYAPEKRQRLNLGIRRRLVPLLNDDRRQIELLNALLFGLPGSPILYYGDEIGMGDNIDLFDRNGVRTPMQWDASANGGFSRATSTYEPAINDEVYGYQVRNVASQRATPNSLWQFHQRLIACYHANPVLAVGEMRWALQPDEQGQLPVLGLWRTDESARILVLANLSDQPQSLTYARLEIGENALKQVLGNASLSAEKIELPAFGYAWLALL